MAQVVKDVVTWLKQWFYTETEVDSLLGNKLNKNLTTANQNVVTDGAGNVVVEAKPTIPSASNSTPSADTTSGGTGNASTFARADHTHPKSSIYAEASHNHSASEVTDSSAGSYTNISSSLSSSSSQADINSAINTKIGELVGIDFITVVQTLPTASSSTMGKIYLVPISGSGNNNFAEYVTVKQGSSYSWEKLGEISGSGLSVDWSDITNKPSTFTPSSHTHSESDITDLKDYIEKSNTSGLVKNDGSIDTTTYISDVSGKSDKTATIGTTITLVDAGETNEGCIIFNTIS